LLLVEKNMKSYTVAREMGISKSRLFQMIRVIHHVLGVSGRVELAFELGRHWKEIKR